MPRDLTRNDARPWPVVVRLPEVARGAVSRRLRPNDATRAGIAAELGLVELPTLEADLEVTPWRDGARVRGDWRARVVQTCGVTLDPLESELSGVIDVRCAPTATSGPPSSARRSDRREAASVSPRELVVDPQGEDPPDVLDDDRIDLSAYVVEHLALDLDPFPRRPDAVFDPPPAEPAPSAFAALAALKPPDETGA